jgi:hypothetical protein
MLQYVLDCADDKIGLKLKDSEGDYCRDRILGGLHKIPGGAASWSFLFHPPHRRCVGL